MQFNCTSRYNPTTDSTKPTDYPSPPTTPSPDAGKGDWKKSYAVIFGTPGVIAVFLIFLAGVFMFNRRRRYQYNNIDSSNSPIIWMSASEDVELSSINFNNA